jgi:gliding motility-associated-like protein
MKGIASIITGILSIVLVLLSLTQASAQTPVISSLDKSFASVNDTVTIRGSGFGNDASAVTVFFGAAEANLVSVANSEIKALVPPATTFSSITVTNTGNGNTGYSSALFLISFGGTTFDPSLLAGPTTFPAQLGVFDLCMCDFDGDGKSDVATSHDNSVLIDIFRNTSSLAALSFNKTSLSAGQNTLNITCRDIDGDGKPDLAASRSGANSIYVFRNQSSVGSISFAAPLELNTTGNLPRKVVIRDLNLDGKPELIASNQASVDLSVFRNTSTPGTISFGPEISFGLPVAALNSAGLSVEDLNGDAKPEIIVNPFLNSNIYILQNNSTTGGTVGFRPVALFNVSGNLSNLVVGDLDGDDRPDIAVSRFLTSDLSILLNQTSNSTDAVSFSSPKIVSTIDLPQGLDLGDIDGDGLADIVVASASDNLRMTLLRNISIPGDFSFERFDLNVNDKSRNVKIGDLNGDAKPDIAYNGIVNNRLGVLLNNNCHRPTITPAGPVTVCTGNTVRLSATGSVGVSYEWFLDGATTGITTAFIDASAGGDYHVVVTSASGTCVETSNSVTVNAIGGAGGAPTATNNGPLCPGGDLELYTPDVAGGTFEWTGPNGFTSAQQNPVIPNFTPAMAGTYQVRVSTGACISAWGSTDVLESSVPDVVITTSDPTTFCQGKNAILAVPMLAAVSYQWQLDGADIPGGNTNLFAATASGSYTVRITNSDNCSTVTPALDLKVLSPPTAGFDAPGQACLNLPVSFSNTSLVDASENLFYQWDFGDGNVSTEASPAHTYSSLGNYTVSLQVHYDDIDCIDTFTGSIDVVDAPVVAIESDRDPIMCEGETITLFVQDIHTAYSWSTGATTSSIEVTAAGIYTVDVTTTAGCVATAQIEVVTLQLPTIMAAADIDKIFAGDTVHLSASGGINYSWSPTEGLSDPNIANPTANPLRTTTYTVTGDDMDGCVNTAEVTITVGEGINVSAKPLFSPNNDGQNDRWIIENIERYPDCTVIIVNRQGNVLYERRPYYGNEWDGTLKGSPVIEGAYYYVIRCEGSSRNAASGSVTLIR